MSVTVRDRSELKTTFDEFRDTARGEDPELCLDQVLALYAYSGGCERPAIDDYPALVRACRIADLSCGRAFPVPEEAGARLLAPKPLDGAEKVLPGSRHTMSETRNWSVGSQLPTCSMARSTARARRQVSASKPIASGRRKNLAGPTGTSKIPFHRDVAGSTRRTLLPPWGVLLLLALGVLLLDQQLQLMARGVATGHGESPASLFLSSALLPARRCRDFFAFLE